ncbi:3-hydroxyacyl-CoA dehydrogenase NAD-binding domain-containing protein [Pseudotabrizicola sp. 4114]|uniref:3-hydroxyacyl-CoA dehydrogenase NAD-binding domain-containing protein n=1 Tax=Pseudotabrizicola sp. 4114 TaxID=2817731 RepID=UPI002857ED73|nr:3-hydroxybutyryl-CoA dehydrogenase [Pseudorhodobacter sp. 4114]
MQSSVAILGAGVMGLGLARHFLRAGFEVAVIDPSAKSLENAQFLLDAAAPSGPAPLFATAPAGLPDRWRDCALVVEAVPERLEIKHAALAAVETFFRPDTLIASNTSGLTTAALTAPMAHPERLAIAHFFNPADVIPVVELIASASMPASRLNDVATLLRRSGKLPAILRREVPGFVANRIQHAMMRECFHLLQEGVADAATLDDILRWSIGVRMAVFGPFLQRDLNGLDTHLAIADYLYPDLSAATTPAPTLRAKVAAGELGRKTGLGFYDWDARREQRVRTAEAALVGLIRDLTAQETTEGE